MTTTTNNDDEMMTRTMSMTPMTSIQDNELLTIVTVMTATMVIMIAMTMTSTAKSIAIMTFITGGIPNPS